MRWPGTRIIVWPTFVVAVAVISVWWGVRREGFVALIWGAPLLGSLLAMAIAGRRRGWLVAGSLGGAAAGAILWFSNDLFFWRLTRVAIFDSSLGAFAEAVGGGVAGAFVGLLAAAVLCLPTALSRLTIRDWFILVAISAGILTGVRLMLRSVFIERLLIVTVTVVVTASGLVFVKLRKKYSCRVIPLRRDHEI